jgi:hypothetical protein
MTTGRHHFFVASSRRRKNSLIVRICGLSLLAAFVVLGAPSNALADASSIGAADAISFVGHVATVCGRVASAKYAVSTRGQPTLLNLDEPYPNQVFTAVIWGKDRATFSYAPESLARRHICVTGKIELYREKAEIVVSGPNQILASN